MESTALWMHVAPRLRRALAEDIPLSEIAQFTHSTTDTVMKWASGQRPAEGARLVRLWHLLATLGYESPELDELPAFQRLVGQLFAFGILSEEEACHAVSLKKYQDMYEVLRGRKVMAPAFTHEELDELYGATLTERIEATKAIASGRTPLQTQTMSVPAAVPDEAPMSPISDDPPPADSTPTVSLAFGETAKVMLASLAGGMLPLARYLVSDTTTPEERSAFRGLVGNDTMLELTALLEQLTSERLRNEHRR